MELDMVSVQRLLKYAALQTEEARSAASAGAGQPAALNGELEFEDVEMRYQVHLEPALKNLTCKIKKGQKVAVVGRTGAGKSSFFQLLQGFRENCAGKITIDGREI